METIVIPMCTYRTEWWRVVLPALGLLLSLALCGVAIYAALRRGIDVFSLFSPFGLIGAVASFKKLRSGLRLHGSEMVYLFSADGFGTAAFKDGRVLDEQRSPYSEIESVEVSEDGFSVEGESIYLFVPTEFGGEELHRRALLLLEKANVSIQRAPLASRPSTATRRM